VATIPTDPAAAVDQSEGVRWYQYVQCGYKVRSVPHTMEAARAGPFC
jgi:hypothetical protein